MLIKYMGTSDNRVLDKGETFGGQLRDGLTQRVAWTVANNHLVDSEQVGLTDEACALLLAMEGVIYGEGETLTEEEADQDTSKTIKEFKDVTSLKTIPPSIHQTTFLGLKGVKNDDLATEGDAEEPTEGERKTEAAAKPVRASTATGAGGRVPAGGATSGTGGDTTTTGTT